jgi:hypothetical protein
MALFPTDEQTVRLVLAVPQALPHGGWGWAVHPEGDPVGEDYVYNCDELRRVFRVWGPIVARTLVRAHWDRFNLTAYGMTSGNLLGRDTWLRSTETGKLIPHGNPMCAWQAAVFPPELQGVRPIRVRKCCGGLGPDRFRKAA